MNADDAFSFEFIDPNDGYIELDLIPNNINIPSGWNIIAHRKPLRVR